MVAPPKPTTETEHLSYVHTDADLPLQAVGVDLVGGGTHERGDLVPARGVVVLREGV